MGGNRELAERFIASLEARDWDAWAELLHPAVVYEIPQSRERIRGRDRYLRFNQEYPGDWHLRPKVTIADERHGVVWFEWLLDGRTDDAMAFFEFADGLITRVTDFWPEPYEPPPGRGHLVERWLPTPRGSNRRSPSAGFSAGAAEGPDGRAEVGAPLGAVDTIVLPAARSVSALTDAQPLRTRPSRAFVMAKGNLPSTSLVIPGLFRVSRCWGARAYRGGLS